MAVFGLFDCCFQWATLNPHEMHDINNVFKMKLVLMVTAGLNIPVIKPHKSQNVVRTFSICN